MCDSRTSLTVSLPHYEFSKRGFGRRDVGEAAEAGEVVAAGTAAGAGRVVAAGQHRKEVADRDREEKRLEQADAEARGRQRSDGAAVAGIGAGQPGDGAFEIVG